MDPSELDLLHAIRLRGLVGTTELSRLTGIPVALVRRTLEAAATADLIIHMEGRISGWSLTPSGRTEVERLLGSEVDALGIRNDLMAAFRSFLEVNAKVLAVCTSWQTVRVGSTVIPNDHSDAGHDAEVLGTFYEVHRRAAPLVGRLGELSHRFAGYDERLAVAHQRISAGDTRWLTRPNVDSYHSIWFELHENLLANLGKERSRQGANPSA